MSMAYRCGPLHLRKKLLLELVSRDHLRSQFLFDPRDLIAPGAVKSVAIFIGPKPGRDLFHASTLASQILKAIWPGESDHARQPTVGTGQT
jgi:hypothetical protein